MIDLAYTIVLIVSVIVAVWLTQRANDKLHTITEDALKNALRELEYAHSRIALPHQAAAQTINERIYNSMPTPPSTDGALMLAPDIDNETEPDLERVL